MKRWLAIFTLAAALGLSTPAAMADRDDKAHGHGRGHGNKHADRDHDRDDDRGWDRREGYEYRSYDRGGRPPGWSRGNKTGWGNCGLPPGQAKKYGCRSYVYNGRPHYYYQDERGRIIVRRPIIEAHGGVVIR
jgi:Ni/Co efflux regulator RcnB